MLINNVVLILREVLEAAYLASLLLAISYFLQLSYKWFYAALVLGTIGAATYASYLSVVSQWFDYRGQEIINATIHATMFICLAWIVSYKKHIAVAMLITVALAMTREVSELVVYYSGIAEAAIFPVLTGSLIGLGIGLSVGALLYYALLNLTYSVAVLSSKILLIITASGLLSQAIGFLIQADIISSQAPLWDSSSILAEESLVGQLLYALLAYEATPAAAQVFAWCISTALLSLGVFLHSKRSAERA